MLKITGEPDTQYTVIDRVDDTGYDFTIGALISGGAEGFESFVIPEQTYAVFETEKTQYPTQLHLALRKQIVSQWLPFSGYALADGPEINVLHWYREAGEKERRYIEIWLPVVRK